MEEDLSASLGERQVAQLVEDDEVQPCQVIGKPALGVRRAPQPRAG